MQLSYMYLCVISGIQKEIIGPNTIVTINNLALVLNLMIF
jgi:hypothetical protein